MTIDGKELFEIRPSFAQEPKVTGSRASRMAASSPSKRIAFFTGKKVVHTFGHRYTLRGSQIAEFEEFFNERRAKWQDFLIPSYHGELGVGETCVTDSPAAGADLYVDWCDYANLYGPADGYLGRYLFILWTDGEFFVAKVNAVAASVEGVHDRLTLDTVLPQDVLTAEPPVVGWVYNVRFASDELEFEFSGVSNAEVEVGYLEHVISTPEADVT